MFPFLLHVCLKMFPVQWVYCVPKRLLNIVFFPLISVVWGRSKRRMQECVWGDQDWTQIQLHHLQNIFWYETDRSGFSRKIRYEHFKRLIDSRIENFCNYIETIKFNPLFVESEKNISIYSLSLGLKCLLIIQRPKDGYFLSIIMGVKSSTLCSLNLGFRVQLFISTCIHCFIKF